MSERQGVTLGYYDIGRTPFAAVQIDTRFPYCLYVPETYVAVGAKCYTLLIAVHGTERAAESYRDEFMAFAAEHDCIVLAPLFPANIAGPDDLENYKFIDYAGIRFDHILLAMVDEVAAKYRLISNRFLLHGFSGGGHFAHRFFYLHPDRLLGVSIGAPGVVTLLDEGKPWWTGVSDLQARFGERLDFDALRRVPVQMVIGAEDKETWEITVSPDSVFWMEGVNDAGVTRLERMAALKASFEHHGIEVRQDIVPAVAHNGSLVLEPVMDFMRHILLRGRITE